MPLEFATLKVIWWLLLGLLLTGFAITDGFDLGVGMLLPVVARTDTERRVAINACGPVWEGNQVWLILGAGAIFAAWPALYAASFSGFYPAMLLLLAGLMLRPVGYKIRSKMPGARWRSVWDWALFTGGLVPALVFGVAIGNVLQGVPFEFDAELRATYAFGLLDLLNPFALLCGLVGVAMFATHGARFLAIKASGEVARRAETVTRFSAAAWLLLFAGAGLWLWFGPFGYAITQGDLSGALPNPLGKTVVRSEHAWFANYSLWPWARLAPALGLAAPAILVFMARSRRRISAFAVSTIGIVGVIGSVGISMFPFLFPSSTHPSSSLTVWDASSSQRTLWIMLLAAIFFMPLIIAYTSWVYRVMRGPVTAAHIESNPDTTY